MNKPKMIAITIFSCMIIMTIVVGWLILNQFIDATETTEDYIVGPTTQYVSGWGEYYLITLMAIVTVLGIVVYIIFILRDADSRKVG